MKKECFKCGVEKERSEFYKHPQMGDGLLGKCKACTKKDATEHRNKNIDRVRRYDIDRAKLPHRKANNAKMVKKYREENPLAGPAHNKVTRAVRSGKLIKPDSCSICGKIGMVHGHHRDYSKPLEVTWVCQACHKQIHKDIRRIAKENE